MFAGVSNMANILQNYSIVSQLGYSPSCKPPDIILISHLTYSHLYECVNSILSPYHYYHCLHQHTKVQHNKDAFC